MNDNPRDCTAGQDDCTEQSRIEKRPVFAVAVIRGGPLAPGIRGEVLFEAVSGGTYVTVEVYGLPNYEPARNGRQPIGPHGFHLHETGNCETGDPNNPFTQAGGHWNPTKQPHGNHAGDFPVLFSNNGLAMMTFFTNKFKVSDIIGKAVVIHQNPDDYRSQPAGNSGKRLACGTIEVCTCRNRSKCQFDFKQA